MLAVQARAVEKRFGEVRALRGVTLEVPEGEFFGLLGPNGAGKTTLISALGGLAIPDAGSLAVMGHDVARDFRAARRAVGIVPQEIVFDPFFTVRETLELQSGYFGLRANGAWIGELIERLGLASKAHANMRSLSGGMKRRVMVAQALVHRPPVIVLDEPTAGVDVELRQALWAFVRGLNEAGHTILLTTHYLEEAQQLCSRIAMMKDGRIVALGSTARLLADFSERVLRVKLERGALPPSLAASATREPSGAWRIPIADVAHVEQALRALREAGAGVESIEVAEPELEEVFVKIMRREESPGVAA
ncbi:MAG TPA: ABC transporter ATP-binding protein [Usitatibacter sp.]|jgi:ABC-2 type transport system ATP-binding protein|nr:ABC transporter ATP-binding protein [Usitatibacter sp.]